MAEGNLIQGFMRMTGLDKVIQREVALRAQLGGIQTQFAGGDDLVGDLATIEEALSQFNMITRMHRERRMRYRDYEAMDNYGDVSVALDIYAEEATQTDLVKDDNLWVTGADEDAVQEIQKFLSKHRMHTLVQGFARNLAKYGDMFLSLRYTYEGIDRILYLPPDYIHRIGPSLDQIKHFKLEHQLAKVSPRQDGLLLPWECVHLRLLSFGFSTLYGRSMIEPARKRWLHLKLLEDAVAIYRLNRAVERIVFYIDVGSASPSESLRIVNTYKRKFGNKRSYIDPSQGTFEQQYDPHNMLENIYWPVNSATERSRIEKLNPPPEQGQLQDLEHFNEKLYVALGIPRDYLTGETSGSWNSREALALQDVRFSRKLHMLQIALLEGLETLCRFHLAVRWGDPDKAAAAQFNLHLADISKVARQQYDTVMLNRVQLLTMMNDLGTQMSFNRDVWVPFVVENFFPDIPKELISQLIIPDAELAAAGDEMDAARNPAPAAPAAAAKKPAAKKKTTTEVIRHTIMNDLLNRDLVEDKSKKLLEDLLAISGTVQGPQDFSFTLDHPVEIPRRVLQELVKQHSKKKPNNVLVEATNGGK